MSEHLRHSDPKVWAGLTAGEQAAYNAGWLAGGSRHLSLFADTLASDREMAQSTRSVSLPPGRNGIRSAAPSDGRDQLQERRVRAQLYQGTGNVVALPVKRKDGIA